MFNRPTTIQHKIEEGEEEEDTHSTTTMMTTNTTTTTTSSSSILDFSHTHHNNNEGDDNIVVVVVVVVEQENNAKSDNVAIDPHPEKNELHYNGSIGTDMSHTSSSRIRWCTWYRTFTFLLFLMCFFSMVCWGDEFLKKYNLPSILSVFIQIWVLTLLIIFCMFQILDDPSERHDYNYLNHCYLSCHRFVCIAFYSFSMLFGFLLYVTVFMYVGTLLLSNQYWKMIEGFIFMYLSTALFFLGITMMGDSGTNGNLNENRYVLGLMPFMPTIPFIIIKVISSFDE
jgi:hypothetical protein